MNKIAVIPARAGSKRIPKKNIKPFLGVPMIARAIRVAKESELFSDIVVSTDDEDIAAISRQHGANTPFVRPDYLADDFTGTSPVVIHAISELKKNLSDIEYVCCIYPCTPLLTANDLIRGYEMMRSFNPDFVFPVVEYSHPVQRSFRLGLHGAINFLHPEYEMSRTQDLERTYHDAGQFYWGKKDSWLMGKRMHGDGLGMVIPAWRVVDIDTEQDWKMAELIFQTIKLGI